MTVNSEGLMYLLLSRPFWVLSHWKSLLIGSLLEVIWDMELVMIPWFVSLVGQVCYLGQVTNSFSKVVRLWQELAQTKFSHKFFTQNHGSIPTGEGHVHIAMKTAEIRWRILATDLTQVTYQIV